MISVQHVVLGTGAVGRSVMTELLKRGESVRMVNRSGKMIEAPDGVEVVAADLYNREQVKTVTREARVVYQCSQPDYTQWVEKFPTLQKSIIAGLTGSQAKLVLVENMYVYGAPDGLPMTEDTPHNAHTRKGIARAEMSHAAFEAHRAGNLRVTAGRGSDFFGPWGLSTAAMGERTFYPLLNGKAAQLVGDANLPHTHTYIPDFGKALVILGERDEADGSPWHVPNDRPRVTQREMVQLIAEAANVEPKFSAMGRLMMRIGGLFVPAAREMLEMMYEFEQPFIVDSSRFENTFGMKATPMRDAVRDTVTWYRDHPANR